MLFRSCYNRQGTDIYECICNGAHDVLLAPGCGGNRLIFQFEIIVKQRPTDILTSDNHRRGARSLGWRAIKVNVPLTSFFDPDGSTSVVSPVFYTCTNVWFDSYGFIREIGGGRLELLDQPVLFVEVLEHVARQDVVLHHENIPRRQTSHAEQAVDARERLHVHVRPDSALAE